MFITIVIVAAVVVVCDTYRTKLNRSECCVVVLCCGSHEVTKVESVGRGRREVRKDSLGGEIFLQTTAGNRRPQR